MGQSLARLNGRKGKNPEFQHIVAVVRSSARRCFGIWQAALLIDDNSPTSSQNAKRPASENAFSNPQNLKMLFQ